MEIFRLFGSILVDSSEAEKSIQKTGDSAKSLSSKIGSGLQTVGKAAAGIATAAAAGAAAAGTALKSAVDSSAEYADTIDKASYRSGLGAENLQRLKYAAEQSGASLDNIEKSAKKLNDRLGEVSEGNEKSAEMFEKLGVSVYDADGNMRSSDDVYNDVLGKLADMGDTAEATAIGTDLFGKAFTDLKPLLAAGSDGINELKDNADALGIVMSQESVTAGVKYGDTIADIKNAMSGAARSIGASVLPMFQKFADKLIDYIPKIQDFIEKIIPIVEELAESIIEPLLDMIDEIFPQLMDFAESLIEPLSDMISSVLPVILDLLGKILPIITDIINELLPPLLDILDDLMPIFNVFLDLLNPVLDVVKALIKPVGEVLEAFEPVVELIAELVGGLLGDLGDGIGTAADKFSEILGPALELVAKLCGEVLMPALEGVIAFFNGDFEGGWQGIGEAFVGVFESIFSTIDGIFGTHLSEWYDDVQEFWRDVGGKLYEMTHGDEIEMAALDSKYSNLLYDFGMQLSENLRSGMTAVSSFEATKQQLRTDSEMLYYFDNRLADDFDLSIVEQRAENIRIAKAAAAENRRNSTAGAWYGDYYKNKSTPHLASGGLAYGQTAAVIGDNADAAVNPEVVAPRSELKSIMAEALADVGAQIAAAVKSAVNAAPQAMDITVRLSDDTELTRAIIRNINDCTRQDGVCVIKGV